MDDQAEISEVTIIDCIDGHRVTAVLTLLQRWSLSTLQIDDGPLATSDESWDSLEEFEEALPRLAAALSVQIYA